jgi:hypothetical protein
MHLSNIHPNTLQGTLHKVITSLVKVNVTSWTSFEQLAQEVLVQRTCRQRNLEPTLLLKGPIGNFTMPTTVWQSWSPLMSLPSSMVRWITWRPLLHITFTRNKAVDSFMRLSIAMTTMIVHGHGECDMPTTDWISIQAIQTILSAWFWSCWKTSIFLHCTQLGRCLLEEIHFIYFRPCSLGLICVKTPSFLH